MPKILRSLEHWARRPVLLVLHQLSNKGNRQPGSAQGGSLCWVGCWEFRNAQEMGIKAVRWQASLPTVRFSLF